MVETSNPNGLMRLGWTKRSLKPGDEITVEGYKAKDGSNTANAATVTMADGRKVFAGSSGTLRRHTGDFGQMTRALLAIAICAVAAAGSWLWRPLLCGNQLAGPFERGLEPSCPDSRMDVPTCRGSGSRAPADFRSCSSGRSTGRTLRPPAAVDAAAGRVAVHLPRPGTSVHTRGRSRTAGSSKARIRRSRGALSPAGRAACARAAGRALPGTDYSGRETTSRSCTKPCTTSASFRPTTARTHTRTTGPGTETHAAAGTATRSSST